MSDTTERARHIIESPHVSWPEAARELKGIVDALAAELAAAEKRNAELKRLARRLLEDPWVDVSSVAEKDLTVAESEMRAYLAAASEGKP